MGSQIVAHGAPPVSAPRHARRIRLESLTVRTVLPIRRHQHRRTAPSPIWPETAAGDALQAFVPVDATPCHGTGLMSCRGPVISPHADNAWHRQKSEPYVLSSHACSCLGSACCAFSTARHLVLHLCPFPLLSSLLQQLFNSFRNCAAANSGISYPVLSVIFGSVLRLSRPRRSAPAGVHLLRRLPRELMLVLRRESFSVVLPSACCGSGRRSSSSERLAPRPCRRWRSIRAGLPFTTEVDDLDGPFTTPWKPRSRFGFCPSTPTRRSARSMPLRRLPLQTRVEPSVTRFCSFQPSDERRILPVMRAV